MIYAKTRDLLRFDERVMVRLASVAPTDPFLPFSRHRGNLLRDDEVYGLAVQLKASRAIRRFINCSIRILGPTNIVGKEHPSRFYRSLFGKLILCFFQPFLRFRKLLLRFEVLVYAGYFGQISGEHYEILKPHPGFYDEYKIHCLAPVQQGDAIGAARPQSGPLHIDKSNAHLPARQHEKEN